MHIDASIRRICLIFGGGLGDVVMLLPSLVVLREHYPRARMEIIGNPLWLELLLQRNYVDRAASIDQVPLHVLFQPIPPRSHPVFDFLNRFDLVVSWFGDREGLVEKNLHAVIQAPVFVFPFRNYELYPGHVSEYYLSTLRVMGIHVESPRYTILPISSNRVEDEPATQDNVAPSFCRLSIHPGSGGMPKNWPLAYFIRVAEEVVRRIPSEITFLLGPAEENLVEELQARTSMQGVVVLKNLPITSLAVVLERSSVYLGNDSGPTHLAASTGIPTIAVFGPTSAERWSPRGQRVRVIQRRTACQPCNGGTMYSCATKDCLVEITPELVLEAMFSLWRSEGDEGMTSARGNQ